MSTCHNCRTRKPGKTEICYDCGLSEVEALQKKDDEQTQRIAELVCKVLAQEVELLDSVECGDCYFDDPDTVSMMQVLSLVKTHRDWPASIKQLLEIKK